MNDVIEQFTTRAATYSDSAAWISAPALLRAHVEACGRTPPGHVLELCCGTGMVGRAFQAAGWNVSGLDLTRPMVAVANRHFPCVCGPAESLPWLDAAFDVVVLRQAYFLLHDGPRVLREARRVLKDDGVLVFGQTVPFGAADSAWLERIHRTKQAQLRRFHTAESLAADLAATGFAVVDTRRLTVRENVTRWMAAAPEVPDETRAAVCALVRDAPPEYREAHRVAVVDGEVLEDWSWVVFTARKAGG